MGIKCFKEPCRFQEHDGCSANIIFSACSEFPQSHRKAQKRCPGSSPHFILFLGQRKELSLWEIGKYESQEATVRLLPSPDKAAHPFNQTAVHTYNMPGLWDTKMDKMWNPSQRSQRLGGRDRHITMSATEGVRASLTLHIYVF